MKRDSVRTNEQLKVITKYLPVCWEEADYADECRPSIAFKNRRYRRRKEDYYVDFSDVVRN